MSSAAAVKRGVPLPVAAPHPFATLQATFRRWDRHDAKTTVSARRSPDREAISLQWAYLDHGALESTRTIRVWARTPHRIRIEEDTDGALTQLHIRNGDPWHIWNAADGVILGRGESDPRCPTIAMLTDPARLLETLQVISCDRGARAGRPTRVLTAGARNRAAGGQIYRLELDAEFGTLLRSAVSRGGLTTSVSEVMQIAYNIEIDPMRFALPRRSGGAGRQ